MSGAPSDWKLVRFLEVMDAWIEREAPDDDTRLVVIDWVMNRYDDPYRGMRREPGLPNLWYGPVPGTESDDTVVVCSYWIFESTRTVRCNDICALRQPT